MRILVSYGTQTGQFSEQLMQRDWINSLRKSRIRVGCLTLELDLPLRFAISWFTASVYKRQIKRGGRGVAARKNGRCRSPDVAKFEQRKTHHLNVACIFCSFKSITSFHFFRCQRGRGPLPRTNSLSSSQLSLLCTIFHFLPLLQKWKSVRRAYTWDPLDHGVR